MTADHGSAARPEAATVSSTGPTVPRTAPAGSSATEAAPAALTCPAEAAGEAGVAVLVLDGPEELVAATVDSARVVSAEADELYVCPTWGQGAGQARAGYALLLRAGDRLEPGCLRALEGFARAQGAQVVTADRIEQGRIRRCQRFSLRLLEQLPYTGRALLVRTDLLRAVTQDAPEPLADVQALPGGSQAQARTTGEDLAAEATEWDLQLRLVDAAQVVEHCPVVAVNQASPVRVGTLGERLGAVRRHLERQGRADMTVGTGPTGLPCVRPARRRAHRVSVIVPTAFTCREIDGAGTRVLVEVLLSALAQTAAGVDCEIVLVVDQDAPGPRLESCRALWPGHLQVVRTSGSFSFSRAVNAGVAAAAGDVVLLLNDDVEPVREGWVQDMLDVLDLPGVGAVGARLLFDDGRIQHIGVVCPPGRLPLHPRVFEPDQPSEPMAQADIEYLAVTGACLMYRRADHDAVGGWEEALPLNFNDVDFCLRLVQAGAAVVCTNRVRLVHRESSTRQAQILDRESAALASWAHLVSADPHIEYWG